jgi:hypothetical protein
MMIIFLFKFCCNIIAPMDENLVASEIHQFVQKDCFDLNELPQEGTIVFYLLLVFHLSLNMMLIFFFLIFVTI